MKGVHNYEAQPSGTLAVCNSHSLPGLVEKTHLSPTPDHACNEHLYVKENDSKLLLWRDLLMHSLVGKVLWWESSLYDF